MSPSSPRPRSQHSRAANNQQRCSDVGTVTSSRSDFTASEPLDQGVTTRFDCPLCDGPGRLRVTVTDTGRTLILCESCGAPIVREVADAVDVSVGALLTNPKAALGPPTSVEQKRKGPPERMPSPERFDEWRANLRQSPNARARLTGHYGIDPGILTWARVGYGKLGVHPDAFIFRVPTATFSGPQTFVQKFWPDPWDWRGEEKKVRAAGRPAGLYPGIPTHRTFLLVEGLTDALGGWSVGVPTYTGTCGMEWPHAWDEHIAGRRIAVMYDAGQFDRCCKRAEALVAAGAKEAWPVDLAAAGLEHGEDLNDLLTTYGYKRAELIRLIRAARRSA